MFSRCFLSVANDSIQINENRFDEDDEDRTSLNQSQSNEFTGEMIKVIDDGNDAFDTKKAVTMKTLQSSNDSIDVTNYELTELDVKLLNDEFFERIIRHSNNLKIINDLEPWNRSTDHIELAFDDVDDPDESFVPENAEIDIENDLKVWKNNVIIYVRAKTNSH